MTGAGITRGSKVMQVDQLPRFGRRRRMVIAMPYVHADTRARRGCADRLAAPRRLNRTLSSGGYCGGVTSRGHATGGGKSATILRRMRMIGTIPRDIDAERFSDYLLAQGMENMVEESSSGGAGSGAGGGGAGGEWQVWVEHDDDLDRAKAELETYLRNPSDHKYDAAVAHAEKIRKQEEKKQERLRTQYVDVRTGWGQPRQWNAPLTMVLLAISLIVGFATQLGKEMDPLGNQLLFASSTPQQREARIQELSRDPRAMHGKSDDELVRLVRDPGLGQIMSGQVWRLVTPIFLHFSPLHLLFNLFWLVDLGRKIEVQRGTLRFAGLVLLAAVLSNLAQYALGGPGFGGMSGVVYALLGYVYIKGRFESHLGLGISDQSVMIMMVWLVLGFTGMIGPIANAAHVGGLVVGAAVAYAPTALRKLKQARRRLQ